MNEDKKARGDMEKYAITAEMNLKKIIDESREVAQALNEFADTLEQIENKYEESRKGELMTDTEIKRRKAICEVAGVEEIEDVSDGFHTFKELYYQRMMLFVTIVKQNKDKAWKSLRHEDGELCFGGGWFIVGIDTPEGSYTYHYEDNFYSLFDCIELERGKHWDGHTEKDVTRLLSIPFAQSEPCEDAVSRQGLLDDFGLSEKTRKYGGDHSGYDTMMLYEIQNVIEGAESVNPQRSGKWIPVSERLPEDEQEVLITYKINDKHHVWSAIWDELHGRLYDKEYRSYISLDCVEAWMPKPKPYRAESEV